METIESMVEAYGDMLFRLCLVQLRNPADAEDAVQDTFIRCIRRRPTFQSEEHRRAWLIRVAINRCRDILRGNVFRNHVDIQSVAELAAPEMDQTESEAIDALMRLPPKYKEAMFLHYVEGYSAKEIAQMIGRTESAVKMRLKKGRELFKQQYDAGKDLS